MKYRPDISVDELRKRLEQKFPDCSWLWTGNQVELFHRLYKVLFVSRGTLHIENTLGRSIYLHTHGRFVHAVCRDRRNAKAIKAAWDRGERTFEGKRIGGGGTYVYRWDRADANELLELIEEVL